MVQAQRDLVTQFEVGQKPKDIRDASSMAVEEADEEGFDAVVIGYDHAVYAARRNSGEIVVFNGWYGRSNSTNSHLNGLKRGSNHKIIEEGRPDRGEFLDLLEEDHAAAVV